MLFTIGTGVAFGSLIFGLPIRRRKWKSLLLVLFAIFGVAAGGAMTGCGTGAKPDPPPSGITGTTAGTYTVTITGASGSTTQKMDLSVTVN
jgi:peptidoglycan/LPS O-acetylase OafA/YrhL